AEGRLVGGAVGEEDQLVRVEVGQPFYEIVRVLAGAPADIHVGHLHDEGTGADYGSLFEVAFQVDDLAGDDHRLRGGDALDEVGLGPVQRDLDRVFVRRLQLCDAGEEVAVHVGRVVRHLAAVRIEDVVGRELPAVDRRDILPLHAAAQLE